MHIELIRNIENIPLDKQSWNKLVKNNITDTVFQTYEWFQCWWRNYGDKHKLVLLIAREDSTIIGFAPLMIHQDRYGRKILRFVGDLNADYCDFVVQGSRLKVINAFLSFLYTSNVDWTSIILLNIPAYSTTNACLQTICNKNKYHILLKKPVVTPTLIIKNRKSSALDKIKKYSVNRHLNKLKKQGNVNFRNIQDNKEIRHHINQFFEQHIKRYELKGMKSLFLDKANRKFYIDLINELNGTEWLLFSTLELDGKSIAYHFGFNYNNKIIWYKPAFDTNYKSLSPGTVMLIKLIEYTIESNHTELDFTIGDEPFKDRFSNRVRFNQNLVIYRSKIELFACKLTQYLGCIFNKALTLYKS